MIFAVILLGLATGCRTMLPIAAICWFAYLGHLPLEGTWGFWAAKLASVIVFTVFAAGELIGDKLPKTPNRTDLFPLLGRIAFGTLVGGLVATGIDPHKFLLTAILGGISALAGTFLGFSLRRSLGNTAKLPPLAAALTEDALVIAASLLALKLLA